MYKISEKQSRLLSLICSFHRACVNENIHYSLACGSALGAVREKGFISWDDDLDIMMSIVDYEIMDANFEKYSSEFYWASPKANSDSPVIYARIYECDVNFDRLEDFPYIDIHVYVGASTDDNVVSTSLNIVDYWTKVYWIKKRKYHHILKRRKSFIGAICKIPLIWLPSNVCKRIVISYANRWDYASSDRLMPLQGYYKMKEVVPRSWIENLFLINFAGKELYLIKEYDSYLKQLYGDYMTPVNYSH